MAIAIRAAAAESAAAFYRPSSGIKGGIGNVRLAGVSEHAKRVLRGYPPMGIFGLKRANVYRGDRGVFGEVRDLPTEGTITAPAPTSSDTEQGATVT